MENESNMLRENCIVYFLRLLCISVTTPSATFLCLQTKLGLVCNKNSGVSLIVCNNAINQFQELKVTRF